MRSAIFIFFTLLFAHSSVQAAPPMMPSIADTIVKMPIVEGVSMDEAVDSLKLRANALNMKLVAHQPLSAELEAQGMEAVRRLEIFQFCDPKTAKKMVDYQMAIAAYLPCRITLVEDEQGQGWFVMMKLDPMIAMADLNPDLQVLAIEVRDSLMEIITAGANGEL